VRTDWHEIRHGDGCWPSESYQQLDITLSSLPYEKSVPCDADFCWNSLTTCYFLLCGLCKQGFLIECCVDNCRAVSSWHSSKDLWIGLEWSSIVSAHYCFCWLRYVYLSFVFLLAYFLTMMSRAVPSLSSLLFCLQSTGWCNTGQFLTFWIRITHKANFSTFQTYAKSIYCNDFLAVIQCTGTDNQTRNNQKQNPT